MELLKPKRKLKIFTDIKFIIFLLKVFSISSSSYMGFKLYCTSSGTVIEQVEPLSQKDQSPQVGFEPTTYRLTADRSTTELLRTTLEIH